MKYTKLLRIWTRRLIGGYFQQRTMARYAVFFWKMLHLG